MSNEKKKGRRISLLRERVFDIEAKLNCLIATLSPDLQEVHFPQGKLNTARQLALSTYMMLQKEIKENDE